MRSGARTEILYFGVAFPLMQSALPQLATLLMRTPLEPEADPVVGPTAGPAFYIVPRAVIPDRRGAQSLADPGPW